MCFRWRSAGERHLSYKFVAQFLDSRESFAAKSAKSQLQRGVRTGSLGSPITVRISRLGKEGIASSRLVKSKLAIDETKENRNERVVIAVAPRDPTVLHMLPKETSDTPEIKSSRTSGTRRRMPSFKSSSSLS